MHPIVRQLLSGALAFALISGALAVAAPLTAQAAAAEVLPQVTRGDIAVELFEQAGAPEGPFAAAGFVDVAADSAQATAIDWLAATRITVGRTDGTFGPDAALSRAAFASMLYRLAGAPDGPFPAAGFVDVAADSVHGTAIAWLAHTGLTVGRDDGTFGPSASVTRTQTATFTTRFTNAPTVSIDVPDVAIPPPPPPAPSPPSAPRPPAATVSSAPVNLTVTPAPTELVVAWEPPTNDGGAAITGYTITVTPDVGTVTTNTTTLTTITIGELDNDTGYTVAVVATNAAGDSPPATATATTLAPPAFHLAGNGVTVRCPDAAVGDTGDVDGITYTKRDKAGITVDNAATTCTSGITDMTNLFSMAATFNQNIGHWDTANVTNMSRMFYYASVFNQDLSQWNTSAVTNMVQMFSGAGAFDQAIGNWDTSSVTNIQNMFYKAGVFNQDLSQWNTSAAVDMSSMFGHAFAFNQDISIWDTANVTNMGNMFGSAHAFNQNISIWNTANVTNMGSMFASARAFNQDISIWDTSAVTAMGSMFSRAAVFNQDLSVWCVQQIPTKPGFFDNYATAWTEPKPQWGVACSTA